MIAVIVITIIILLIILIIVIIIIIIIIVANKNTNNEQTYSRLPLDGDSIVCWCFEGLGRVPLFQRRGGLKGPDDEEEDDKAWL